MSAFQYADFSPRRSGVQQFHARYPASTNAAQAALLQAEAEFKLGKLTNAIALLSNRMAEAGSAGRPIRLLDRRGAVSRRQFSGAAETFVVAGANDFPESSLRLRAVVEAAAAHARLGEWPSVVALLAEPNGVFQRRGAMEPANELVFARAVAAGAGEI